MSYHVGLRHSINASFVDEPIGNHFESIAEMPPPSAPSPEEIELDNLREPRPIDRSVRHIIQDIKHNTHQMNVLDYQLYLAKAFPTLKAYSLHTIQDLPFIHQICTEWLDGFERLHNLNSADRNPFIEDRALILMIQEQAERSLDLLQRLQGPFFKNIAYNALQEIAPRAHLTQQSFPTLYKVCRVFAETPILNSQIIQLTPQGLHTLQERIKEHVQPHFKKALFYCLNRSFTLSSKTPEISGIRAQLWVNQALQTGKIRDIQERFDSFDPRPIPVAFGYLPSTQGEAVEIEGAIETC